MVKSDGNIDLVFRDGLKDLEVLPPSDIWSGVSSAIIPSNNRGLVFRVAAGIATLVSLGLLSYYIGTRTSDSLLGPLTAELQMGESIIQDNTIISNTGSPVLAEAIIDNGLERIVVIEEGNTDGDELFAVNKDLTPEYIQARDLITDNDLGNGVSDLQAKVAKGVSLDLVQDNDMPLLDMKSETSEPNRWRLGAKLSPTYLSTNLKTASNNISASTDNESAALSYTGGISVSYLMGNRLSLQTGVYYSSLARQISGIESYSGYASHVQAKSGKLFGIETSAGEIAATNNDIYLADANSDRISGSTVNSFDPQKADLEQYGSTLRQNFEYLEVPLILSYKLIDRKVDFNISGGMAYNFLLGNATYAVSESSKVQIGSTEGMNPLLLSSAFAMSMEYSLSDKFSFNIEPSFRYFLNSNGSLISNNPFTFGFFSGLYYKF